MIGRCGSMKIAVFGSTGAWRPIGDAIRDRDTFKDFCVRLGAVLSGFPYGLLVRSDSSPTADRLVVDGLLASRQAQKPKIWVYYESKGRARRPFARDAAVNPGVFLFNPIPGVQVTTSHMRMLRDADVAIVVGGGANSYSAGIAASLMRVRLIPVATFGGAGRLLWQQLSDQLDSPIANLPVRGTWENLAGTPERVIEIISQEITAFPRLMIVHGRSSDRVLVERILRSHNVTDPIVLQERFKVGETIPEKFEREALQVDGALVLFTPDDEAASLPGQDGKPVSTDELRRRVRARQNVSLEYGWFWARLGRDRVLLLIKGELELPSDLAGLSYHSYGISPNECQEAITDFIDGIRNR
jgi:predicted nucleotide-binding protein with TIR-like domain